MMHPYPPELDWPVYTEIGPSRSPFARKEYRCDICGERILEGEQYRKHAVKDESDDSKVVSFRHHFVCSWC